MRWNKRFLAAFLSISIIALSGCGNSGGDEADMGEMDMEVMMAMMGPAAVNVETAYPTIRTIAQSGNYIGTIETGDKISVIPRVSGRVAARNVSVGDHVNAGDVLFTIDDHDLQVEKKRAEDNVAIANANLAKTKANNEAAQAAVTETLNTVDNQSQANLNSIDQAIRAEYSAQVTLYKAYASEEAHKEKKESLEDLIKKDENALDNAKAFTNKLRGDLSAYNDIASAPDLATAVERAHQRGVTDGNIDLAETPVDVAAAYLKQCTIYEDKGQLEKAITTAEEAEQTARDKRESDKSSLRSTNRDIDADHMDEEIAAQGIATAQESTAMKRRVADDYEMYTKAKIWAEQQAKLAENNATLIADTAALSKAKSELEAAELKLGYTSVTAPVSGEVVECKIEDFGLASEQNAAYTLIDPSKKKAVFYVTADARNNMSVGQKVTLNKDGTDYSATVDSVSETVDEKSKLYKVTAELGKDDLDTFDAGTSVRLITSIRKSENALTIPIGIVYYDEGRAFVYVARDGVAEKKLIETGIDDATDIEVLSGLTPDDQVIVSWSEQLQDNAAIQVMNVPEKPAPVAEAPAPVSDEPEETEPVQEEPAPVYVETTTRVNVRKGPGTGDQILDTVTEGTRVEKLGEENGWTKVLYNGQEAWMSSDYVRESEG